MKLHLLKNFNIFILSLLILLAPLSKGFTQTFFNYSFQASQTHTNFFTYSSEFLFNIFLYISYSFSSLFPFGIDTIDHQSLLPSLLISSISLLILSISLNKLGLYSVVFACYLSLDPLSSNLPFYLLRSYIALVLCILSFILYYYHSISKSILLLLFFASVFIHFSFLFVFFASLSAYFLYSKLNNIKTILSLSVRNFRFYSSFVFLLFSACFSFALLLPYLTEKLFFRLQPFPLISYVGEGSGFSLIINLSFLFIFTYYCSTYSNDKFLSIFTSSLVLLGSAFVFLIGDPLTISRSLVIMFPLVYLLFLLLTHSNMLPKHSFYVNASFLFFLVGTTLYNYIRHPIPHLYGLSG